MSPLGDHVTGRLLETLAVPELPSRYRQIDVLGRGGMGVVWRAHDQVLARDVAVKVLGDHVHEDALAERLLREARILASLEHPGIVAVHDSGTTTDGRTWYAMRLVRGSRLDAPDVVPETLGDLVRLMTRLAETVAFAHEHGIIHRDLKPANVMVGPFGEVLVLDWGVASRRGEVPAGGGTSPASPDGPHTAAGTVLGTPGYMAPEQAAGLPADERSDVYGLGAVLRDLLAARPGPTPKRIEAIRDTALATAPAHRYASAVAFAADLRRFQDGEPVHAYAESRLEQLWRVAGKYRTPIALVVAYLIMRLVVLAWRGV